MKLKFLENGMIQVIMNTKKGVLKMSFENQTEYNKFLEVAEKLL